MTETIGYDVEKPSKKSGSSMGLCVVTCLLMAAALYAMLWHTPVESTAALAQRMLYVYVPAAWVSGVAFVLLMLTSVGYLFTTQAVWHSRASAMAEAGLVFCTVTVITGVSRGKALTGHWWNPDMVSAMMLVLWGLLVAYLSLRHYAATQAARKWLAGFSVIMCFSVPVAYSGLTRILPTRNTEMVVRQYAGSGFDVLLALMAGMSAFFFMFWYVAQHRVSLDIMEAELEQLRQTALRQTMLRQTALRQTVLRQTARGPIWQAKHVLVENQNFVIEGYNFTESQENE